MEITTVLGRDCLLHFKENELVAVHHKGALYKVELMNQGELENFYSVDIVKV